MKTQKFGREDWYAYAGAERFTDGSDPLIGECRVDGEEAIAVFDGEGVFVHLTGTEDRHWSKPSTRAQAWAQLLEQDLKADALTALGFTQG